MGENSEHGKTMEKVWNIRSYIQTFEDFKHEIINLLKSLKKLDESTRNIWISDVKEFYYNMVSAWEMLKSGVKGEQKYLISSKSFLYGAQSRLSQVISELKTFQNEKTSKLIKSAEKTFNECWDLFWLMFKKFLPKQVNGKLFEKTIKISDLEYHIHCSICDKIAVEFKIGYGRFDKDESLVFKGITHGTSLKINLAEELFIILREEDLLGVHQFMISHHTFEGLDAYCPKCDKIYCWEHYNAREEFDDGFYDCTYGICPHGHRRMIDD